MNPHISKSVNMKGVQLSPGIRIILFLCGVLLIFVLFNPIWKIELSAPQYPEGLILLINANGLGGDVDIINGLNHYIGMKTLHDENFIEFKILPYLVSVFALSFFIVALIGNRKLMLTLFTLFLMFGTVAMIDFWRWEYNYGHNLDPNAAIVVPGMAYQPPLIGYKQLLNFGAYAVPHIGGWLFVSAGMLLLLCIIADYQVRRKATPLSYLGSPQMLAPIISIVFLSNSGCSTEPEPIKLGKDNCHYCKMTISDNKYGAEVITTKGKIFKYDDPKCFFSEISEGGIDKNSIKDFYFTDFCKDHGLIKSQNGFYIRSNGLKSPMGGNIAGFSSRDSLKLYTTQLGGEEVIWNQIFPVK